MSTLKEKQKAEAVKRMKKLHLLAQPIREFKNEGLINRSERGGILYWLEDDEKEIVKRFEEEWDGVVYHVIKSYTSLGLMYSLLFVSKYEEEWEMEDEEIEGGYVLAWVENIDMPDCSEMGTIVVEPSIGGLRRIG